MLLLFVLTGCRTDNAGIASTFPSYYQGQLFADASDGDGPQKIPGRVKLAYYDLRVEGIYVPRLDAKIVIASFTRPGIFCGPPPYLASANGLPW